MRLLQHIIHSGDNAGDQIVGMAHVGGMASLSQHAQIIINQQRFNFCAADV